MTDVVLKRCPQIEVLVIVLGSVQSVTEHIVLDSLGGVIFADDRVVVVDGLFMVSWTQGTRGEDNVWAIAERTIKERKLLKGMLRSL